MAKVQVNLYQEHCSDLPNTMATIAANGYDSVTAPVVYPSYIREFHEEPMKSRHITFSRSDLVLKSMDWLHKIISKLSDTIDCDSEDATIRRHSEKTLLQEISFAEHLVQHGYIAVKVKSPNSANLARLISRNIKGLVLAEVPMVSCGVLKQHWRRDINEDEIKEEDTWNWWNNFRTCADFHIKIKLALEVSADIPSRIEVLRWLGEPIECLIIPASLFIRNKSNYPVLTSAHQDLVGAFLRNNVNLMLKASIQDGSLPHYSSYLRHLAGKYNHTDPMTGFDDLLEIPLQPLYDNLDSYTYEIFEKDPVKYHYYQRAIELALIDRVPEASIDKETVIVFVVGAGRGPLVRATLNAAANTKRKIKIFVIEKNPNAIITLTALVEELWSEKDVTIISTDMRDFKPPKKADILVSELLGSIGDNELSPECLDGAQMHLKPDGISIPSKSTSYINPAMSSKLFNHIRSVERSISPRDRMNNYTNQAESNYVVYPKNVFHIADAKPLFEFVHPNLDRFKDNERFTKVEFEVAIDCVLNGFCGYFDTVLYKDVILSIHPLTHTKGLISWFSIFFPIAEPQHLKAGDKIEVNFWRCVGSHKVWYEWQTTSPHITHVHNTNGRSATILM